MMARHIRALQTAVFIACLTPILARPGAEAEVKVSGSGCGATKWIPGLTYIRFLKSAGHSRSYWYHLPSSYDKSKPYPVVVAFHGSQMAGPELEVMTKLDEKQYSGETIMIYPNGIDRSWAGPSYHKGSSVEDDVQFATDVVNDVKSMFCVDEKRVFALGYSNGGGFIGTLACASNHQSPFAGLAAQSGSFYTDARPNSNCRPSKPVPLLEIHGTEDSTVPYNGTQTGEGGTEPSISDWFEWWAERYQCNKDRKQKDEHDGQVQHYSWDCQGKTDFLQHYKVNGLGHCWADTKVNVCQVYYSIIAWGSPNSRRSYISSSRIVMDFFDKIPS